MQKIHSIALFPGVFLSALLLSGCVTNPPQTGDTPVSASSAQECPVCPVCPEPAMTVAPSTTIAPAARTATGVPLAPPPPVVADVQTDVKTRLHAVGWKDLPGWQTDNLEEAWQAFLLSCNRWKLRERKVWNDWQGVCEKASRVKGGNEAIRHFFETELRPYALMEVNGQTEGVVTGYYEPLIQGSRQRNAQNNVPVLAPPPDMLTIDLGELYPDLKFRRLRGRLVGNKVIPYWTRAEIEARPDGEWPGEPILWVSDPVEFFFLQVQGSGRVELPDGRFARIGYADQNGHPYRSIGRALIERGELKLEEASMQGIQAWARRYPGRLRALLDENPSYVFFRELTDDDVGQADGGPLGALGVSLTAGRSIAVDPRHVTLGVPVWLATTHPNSRKPLNRLVLAQDTGGAIKGGVRADFFWGFGKEAGLQAGRMKQRGRMWLLLPRAHTP